MHRWLCRICLIGEIDHYEVGILMRFKDDNASCLSLVIEQRIGTNSIAMRDTTSNRTITTDHRSCPKWHRRRQILLIST
jgi:hypothetical protein